MEYKKEAYTMGELLKLFIAVSDNDKDFIKKLLENATEEEKESYYSEFPEYLPYRE